MRRGGPRVRGGVRRGSAVGVSAAKRIQLRRTKGWRKPEGAVVVARPSKWGNPFRVGDCIEAGFASDEQQARVVVVHAFADWLRGDRWADGSGPHADKRHLDYLASMIGPGVPSDFQSRRVLSW